MIKAMKCSYCKIPLPAGRRKYCSDECVDEARKRRRRIKQRSVKCKWCQKSFRRERKGHRFCSGACRIAGWRYTRKHNKSLWAKRLVLASLASLRKRRWPYVPCQSYVELHFDAGRYHDTWWGSLIGWKCRLGEDRQRIVVEQGQIEGDFPGPTPPEGIAAIYALKWAQKHVKPGEVIVIVGDNQPVMSKLQNGSIQGRDREIWEELKLQAELFKKGNRMLQVWTVRSYENEADHLAGQHPNAAVWKIKPPSKGRLKLVKS